AVTEFKEATRLYKENYSAWFHLGEAYRKKKVWPEAVTAYTNAVKYKSSEPMYRLRLGAALYEAAIEKARQDEATRTGKKLEEVQPDLQKVDFDQAQQHLEAAVAGNAGLFNGHYYLGKIHQHRNR